MSGRVWQLSVDAHLLLFYQNKHSVTDRGYLVENTIVKAKKTLTANSFHSLLPNSESEFILNFVHKSMYSFKKFACLKLITRRIFFSFIPSDKYVFKFM